MARVVTILALSAGCILLMAFSSWGEEVYKKATPSPDDPYLLWRLDAVREKAREVPQNIWERIRNAGQWVWDEYPDQVLLKENAEIKWNRYLSAAFNVPQWLEKRRWHWFLRMNF